MKPCSNFTPHEWKRDICCECFEKKENHISNQVTARIGSTVTLTSSGTEQKSSSTNQSDRKSSGFNRETIAAFEKILESTAPNSENIAIKLSKNNPMNIHKTSDASELNVSRKNSNVSEQNTVTNALLKSTEDSSSEKGTHSKELKPCQYGMECRRQNPTHFEEYSHPPGFTIKLACINQTTELSFKQGISRKEIKPCRYGMKCRRQNPTHFEEYSHPPGFTMISTTIYPVTEPLLEKEKKLHIINAKPLEDLDTKKINEINSQKVTTLEQKLLEQQNVSEKHVRLVEERFRASIADSEAKIKKYENEIEKLQRDFKKMAQYHQQLEQALGEELDKRERREIEIKNILPIKRDTPSYWGINAFVMPYREVYIGENSIEYNIISKLLNDTIESHDNHYGTINGRDPTEFIVTQIRRIQNKKLWHEYCFKKEQIIPQNNRNLSMCASSKYLQDHPFLTPLLDSNVNEYWLFHGCDKAKLPFLLYSGYDPRVSNLNGMFGGGFYLAENSSKSNQYISCPTCGNNSIFTTRGCECKNQEDLLFSIVLYRAVLGDVHIAQVYDKKKYRGNDENRVRRPPLKGNDIDLYDSVLGESKKHGGDILKYREVILYESGQAYPEYVIEYRRSALNAKPSSGAKRAKDMCYNFIQVLI
ncbi:unnamed protein product [Rotaria sordida]|uniref:Poly [ADP-ribose] polymerase n=1 Tax=Rotaria sordida TaxID=392033 RepID=A0A819YLK1_9BILA|nr:unnamed protein product [Rotaria sordida]